MVSVGTGSVGSTVWSDPEAAAIRRDTEFPPVPNGAPRIGVLDFGETVPTPAALLEFLVPLAEGVRSGRYGQFALFVSAPDDATREFVQYLSTARDFAIFVAPSLGQLNQAVPAGDLTPTEHETLDVLARVGGTITASDFAASIGIGVTTAGNRLINLSRRGYVQRIPQSGRGGDRFVDPRTVRPHSSL